MGQKLFNEPVAADKATLREFDTAAIAGIVLKEHPLKTDFETVGNDAANGVKDGDTIVLKTPLGFEHAALWFDGEGGTPRIGNIRRYIAAANITGLVDPSVWPAVDDYGQSVKITVIDGAEVGHYEHNGISWVPTKINNSYTVGTAGGGGDVTTAQLNAAVADDIARDDAQDLVIAGNKAFADAQPAIDAAQDAAIAANAALMAALQDGNWKKITLATVPAVGTVPAQVSGLPAEDREDRDGVQVVAPGWDIYYTFAGGTATEEDRFVRYSGNTYAIPSTEFPAPEVPTTALVEAWLAEPAQANIGVSDYITYVSPLELAGVTTNNHSWQVAADGSLIHDSNDSGFGVGTEAQFVLWDASKKRGRFKLINAIDNWPDGLSKNATYDHDGVRFTRQAEFASASINYVSHLFDDAANAAQSLTPGDLSGYEYIETETFMDSSLYGVTSGGDGGARYKVHAAGTLPNPDGYSIIDYGSYQLELSKTITPNPFMFGALGYNLTRGNSADDADALNRLFKYQNDNSDQVIELDTNGKFKVGKIVKVGNDATINGAGARVQNLVCSGAMILAAEDQVPLDCALFFDNITKVVWSGIISIEGGTLGGGNKGASWAARTLWDGVRFGVVTHLEFSGWEFKWTKHGGNAVGNVHPTDGVTSVYTAACKMGSIRAFDCGSGFGHVDSVVASAFASLYSDYTVNAGLSVNTNSTFGQKTVLDVLEMPPVEIDGYNSQECDVYIDGHVYEVSEINRADDQITIFPRLRTAAGVAGNLMYFLGGAAVAAGNDSNLNEYPQIVTQRCGAGFRTASIYGHNVRLTSQFDGIALSLGAGKQAANVGGTYQLYAEGELVTFHQRMANGVNILLDVIVADHFETGGYHFTGTPLSAGDRPFQFNQPLQGIGLTGTIFNNVDFTGWPPEYQETTNGYNLTVRKPYHGILRDDAAGLIMLQSAYEMDTAVFHSSIAFAARSDANVAPTGAFTFNCPVGQTIANGNLATGRRTLTLQGFSASGMVGPADIRIQYNQQTKIWYIYAIGLAFDYVGTTGVGNARRADVLPDAVNALGAEKGGATLDALIEGEFPIATTDPLKKIRILNAATTGANLNTPMDYELQLVRTTDGTTITRAWREVNYV